ncbi:hypothetical protein HK097_009163 [Rhizophlyctis rosea]|uniref:gamma-glutamylcyclotransferase n=1 Tax=Rhizophlyctis rosea TaxID=64517 RepID=A0AAD5SBN3_9FUNG|nr:hypothetical protein HK097_009163 [Rhizophlyctis rosea]
MSQASSLQREAALEAKTAPPQVKAELVDDLNTPESDDDLCWYLAYGSNMTTKVLTGRRQVKPLEAIPVTCEGYRLAFDCRGLPYFEPAFASIRPIEPTTNGTDPVPRTLHGVAFKITKRAYQHIRQTEGGGGHDDIGYLDITVTCTPYPSYPSTPIQAHTLLFKSAHPNLHPSLRYLNLLRDGAREFKLDPSYIAYLDNFPHYQSVSIRQKVGAGVFVALFAWVPLTYWTFVIGLGRTFGLKPPRWTVLAMDAFANLAWKFHDWVLTPIFGAGTKGIETGAVNKKVE